MALAMSLMLLSTVQLAGLIASIAFLIAASLSDLRTREVSNQFWTIYGPMGMLLFAGQIILSDSSWTMVVASAGVTVLIAFGLFFVGAMGGADSKALICLGLAMPVTPGFIAPVWESPFGFYPFPVAVLVNSFLLSILSGVFILGRNVSRRFRLGSRLFQGFEAESVLRKILVLFTSYKTSYNQLQVRSYLYPAEQVDMVDSRPVRRFRISPSAEQERDTLLSGLEPYRSQGFFSDGIWVTPGLPHLAFIVASLLVTLVIGDLLMWAFMRMVSIVG